MPIRDLSDRAGALPTIGELRKGAPQTTVTRRDGRAVPKIGADLGEHFRFTSDDGRVVQAFTGIYGEHPAEIPCLLGAGTTDEAFEAWNEEFGASGLRHRCDGVQLVYRVNPDDSRERWELGAGPDCPYAGMTRKERPKDACRPHGRLKIIPVTQDRDGRLRVADLRRIGQVLVLTTSKHDIKNIAECLRLYESLHGTLHGVPFVLRRTPAQISTPRDEGGRVRQTKWLIDLTAAPEWVSLKLESARMAAFSARPGAVAALPAARIDADQEDDEDERDVDHETGEIRLPPEGMGVFDGGNTATGEPPRRAAAAAEPGDDDEDEEDEPPPGTKVSDHAGDFAKEYADVFGEEGAVAAPAALDPLEQALIENAPREGDAPAPPGQERLLPGEEPVGPPSALWPEVEALAAKLDRARIRYTLPRQDQTDAYLRDWMAKEERALRAAAPAR